MSRVAMIEVSVMEVGGDQEERQQSQLITLVKCVSSTEISDEIRFYRDYGRRNDFLKILNKSER